MKGILFGGCSFTWGQGLYFYSDLNRLTYIGYGDTKPKVKNDSEINLAINRRTEFKVIGK